MRLSFADGTLSVTAATDPAEDFHALLLVEGEQTGDGRMALPDSITWREPPLPLMVLDETTYEHQQAKLVANFTRIVRSGAEIHGYGTFVESDDPDVIRLQTLIRNGDLRGVSVDLDAIEYEIHAPMVDLDEPLPVDDEGRVIIESDDTEFVYTQARIMGATVLPFPAFPQAFIETTFDDALVAAAIPVDPPSAWFLNPNLTGPTPLRVDDDGRVVGHLALWESCHIGFADQCVTAPRSAANYAHFLTGELVSAEGDRFSVGQITLDAHHAPYADRAAAAVAHYDHTGTATADVVAGEDEYGIWLAGALRPDVDSLTLRRLRAADLSGDWRRIGSALELVAVLAVNVPGFHKPRASVHVRREDGLVASLVASLPVCDRPTVSVETARVADRIAKTIGRDRESRLAALRASVHGSR